MNECSSPFPSQRHFCKTGWQVSWGTKMPCALGWQLSPRLAHLSAQLCWTKEKRASPLDFPSVGSLCRGLSLGRTSCTDFYGFSPVFLKTLLPLWHPSGEDNWELGKGNGSLFLGLLWFNPSRQPSATEPLTHLPPNPNEGKKKKAKHMG